MLKWVVLIVTALLGLVATPFSGLSVLTGILFFITLLLFEKERHT